MAPGGADRHYATSARRQGARTSTAAAAAFPAGRAPWSLRGGARVLAGQVLGAGALPAGDRSTIARCCAWARSSERRRRDEVLLVGQERRGGRRRAAARPVRARAPDAAAREAASQGGSRSWRRRSRRSRCRCRRPRQASSAAMMRAHAVEGSGSAPRSAASRAAVPSSTPRSSIASSDVGEWKVPARRSRPGLGRAGHPRPGGQAPRAPACARSSARRRARPRSSRGRRRARRRGCAG